MAAIAEGRMNLAALQQRDPYITDIVDTPSQVALYSFSSKSNEWEKTDIEGTLFVYTRSASPINGFMILNRLGLNNLIEPITKEMEFQLQDPFLLYRNASLTIYGIWFYDNDECARIGQLMNSLVQVANENHKQKAESAGRQRRASESDSMVERVLLGLEIPNSVDILQMLSKAQDEYDKSKGATPKKAEPKPMIDNPSAAATKGSSLIKPLAVKVNQPGSSSADESSPGAAGGSTTPNTQISLEALFKKASISHSNTAAENRSQSLHRSHSLGQALSERDGATAATEEGATGGAMPPLLQRLMSQPGNTLEEIERQQHEKGAADSSPRSKKQPPDNPGQEPESPATDIKRKLNILPPNPATSGPLPQQPQLKQSPPGGSTSTTCTQDLSFSRQRSISQPTGPMPLPGGLPRPASGSFIGTQTFHTSGSYTGLSELAAGGGGRVGGGNSGGAAANQGLITPTALLQGAASTLSAAGTGASNAAAITNGSSNSNFLTKHEGMAPPASHSGLLPPTAFEMTTTRHSPTQGGAMHNPALPPPPTVPAMLREHTAAVSPSNMATVTPLTKEQIQQAVLYLIKNDGEFINKIHEAYIKSLMQKL